MFEKILENVKVKSPLVHNITNYVTVNDCANIVLAIGGSPIMSDDISEVEEITSICSSLVINTGTLGTQVNSMLLAGKKCNELLHPVVLDPVAAGASKLRTETVYRLLDEVKFSVIRGNISEIKTIYAGSGTTRGVDADEADAVSEDNIDGIVKLAKELSKRTSSVISISGAIDIVADESKAYVIKNGHPIMSKITGTGCMLTALIGAFCGANYDSILESTSAAVCSMGLCGELAYEKMIKTDGGTLSFRTYLIDYISKLTPEMLDGGMKIEVR